MDRPRRESTPARSAARPDPGARTVWRTVSTSTSSSPPRCPLQSESGGAAAEPPVTALPILPEPEEQVNQPITLKRSVTGTKGGASKPVLPPPPERRPRDGTRAPRVCRGDASAVSTSEQGGARRPVGRVLSGHGRSSQGRDPALGRGAAGARASRGAAPPVWPRAPARARAGLARQRLSLGQTAAPHPARVAAGAAHASRRAGVAPRAERLARGQSRHPGPLAAAPAPPPAPGAAAMLARPA